MKILSILSLGLLVSMLSCTDPKEVNPKMEQTKVYSVGIRYTPNNTPVATLWKDGKRTSLSDTTRSAEANGLFVKGSDEYVVGFVSGEGNHRIAALWKNGVVTLLSDGNYDAVANSVFVSGSDVYVAGFESKATLNRNLARLWKNGVLVNLSDSDLECEANDVYVSGSDIYVVGFETLSSGFKVATIWKNSVTTYLTTASYAAANSIYVSGQDVYVVGEEHDDEGKSVAKLWKNGLLTNLSDGSKNEFASSIVVNGADVYILVSEFNEAQYNITSRVLKNGSPTVLPPSNRLNAIAVSGSDIYGVGSGEVGTSTVARYWKKEAADAAFISTNILSNTKLNDIYVNKEIE